MGDSVEFEIRDLGPQPLDGLMRARGMENHVLVEASGSALTHKQVQRARRGRRLTWHMQKKVAEAWVRASGTAEGVGELFTYRGH